MPARLSTSPDRGSQWVMRIRSALALVALAACTQDHHTVDVAVTTDAMAPTLARGDTVHYDPRRRDPDRGDVIVLRDPCAPGAQLVGRVVAIGGESVELRCGELYVDGDLSESSVAAGDLHHDELGGVEFDTLRSGPIADFPGAEPPRCAGQPARGAVVARTEPSEDPCGHRAHLEVPEDTVFVLGDHRDVADDSRRFGAVPLASIEGTVVGHTR